MRDLTGAWLLYDNQADPYQFKNLIGKSEYASVQGELDTQLKRKLASQHDGFRPGPEYIHQWGYTVDRDGTVPFRP